MRFRFGIQVCDSGLGFRFVIQVCDSGLGFRFAIQDWDSGLRFRFAIQVRFPVPYLSPSLFRAPPVMLRIPAGTASSELKKPKLSPGLARGDILFSSENVTVAEYLEPQEKNIHRQCHGIWRMQELSW